MFSHSHTPARQSLLTVLIFSGLLFYAIDSKAGWERKYVVTVPGSGKGGDAYDVSLTARPLRQKQSTWLHSATTAGREEPVMMTVKQFDETVSSDENQEQIISYQVHIDKPLSAGLVQGDGYVQGAASLKALSNNLINNEAVRELIEHAVLLMNSQLRHKEKEKESLKEIPLNCSSLSMKWTESSDVNLLPKTMIEQAVSVKLVTVEERAERFEAMIPQGSETKEEGMSDIGGEQAEEEVRKWPSSLIGDYYPKGSQVLTIDYEFNPELDSADDVYQVKPVSATLWMIVDSENVPVSMSLVTAETDLEFFSVRSSIVHITEPDQLGAGGESKSFDEAPFMPKLLRQETVSADDPVMTEDDRSTVGEALPNIGVLNLSSAKP